MTEQNQPPDSGRKLFFGLFVFPLVIAVGMAVLLCAVVLMTHEKQTPETLIAAIKTSPPSKRWQKAYELSNELNKKLEGPRAESVTAEVAQMLADPEHYDVKTRMYMALALAQRNSPESVAALRGALRDPSDDVRIYALWALGSLKAREAAQDIASFTASPSAELRKTAAYVLGALGEPPYAETLHALLSDPVHDVRWNAALALARLGDERGSAVLLKMLDRQELSQTHAMGDAEIEAVMINAAKGLALIRKAEAVKILKSVSRSDKSMKVRQAALDSLKARNER